MKMCAGFTVLAGCLLANPSQAQLSWAPVATASSPPSSVQGAMAFDGARGLTVLHLEETTWEYDGVTWTQVAMASTPIVKSWAMAYDSARGMIVMQGGVEAGFPTSATWEYDGASWTLASTSGPAEVQGRMCFDTATARMVFLGQSGATWEYDGSTWSLLSAGPAPAPFVLDGNLFYDTVAGKVIYVGGDWTFPFPVSALVTFEYDYASQSWIDLTPTVNPPARIQMAAAYDSARGGIVIHGGLAAASLQSGVPPIVLTDTWIYDAAANSWVDDLSTGGPERIHPLSTYDAARSTFVLYSGASPVDNETWEYGLANPGLNYCLSLPNSSGKVCVMRTLGSTSVAQNDLELVALNSTPNQSGLFHYGANQTQQPFGDGYRCISGAVFRFTHLVSADSFGRSLRPLDLTQAPLSTGPGQITAGSTWNFQFWYRDSFMPGGAGFNLSDGLSLTFTP